MQAIAREIYIENQYPGVTLGAVNFSRGLVQIDAPPSPEDGRAWRAALLNLGGSTERVLVNLDAHPDRTLGARAMDCTVLAHEKTANVFRSRPSTFKAQGEETGADWEGIPGLGNIRWAPPEISFSQRVEIHWGETPMVLEHHPGPADGAIWVLLPEVRVVFIGDAVVRGQPPFLASANIPVWLETLKVLLSPEYRNYLVVSGRGGLIPAEVIRNQKSYLEQVQTKVEKLAKKKAAPEAVENLVASLLSGFKGPAARHRQYAQRLRHGLYHYYVRTYRPTSGMVAEE